MKEILNNAIRKLLCSVLTIAMVLFNSIAVFADDNELTEYKAEYDAETEEVSF